MLPAFAPAWWVAGEVAERQGRTADAIRSFETATSLGLDDPRALVHLARLLIDTGHAPAAKPYLERAARLGPDTPSGEEARRLLLGIQ